MTSKYDAVIIGGMALDFHGRPLGPFRLRTAASQAGYSVKVVDFASVLDADQLIDLLNHVVTDQTKVIGISTSWTDFLLGDGYLSYNTWFTAEFFSRLKKQFPNCIFVGGGTRVDVDVGILQSLDWFMLGFSDQAFVKLLDHVIRQQPQPRFNRHDKFKNTKVVDSNAHYLIEDHDQIETAMIAGDDFKSYQPIPLEVSRGCIFKCSFCTHPFLGKKSYDYIRSPQSIASELKRNYELFGTYRYAITDDTFNDSIEKLDRVRLAIELAKIPNFEFVAYIRPEILITKSQMIPMLADMGLKGALFGVESLNNKARKFVGKGTDVARVLDVANQLATRGVKLHATMILGLPGDTVEDWYAWHEHFKSNSDSLFKSWSYHALNIRNRNVQFDNVNEGYSVFEKDPAQYGYFDHNGSVQRGERFLHWINAQGITQQQAVQHQEILTRKTYEDCRIGGWQVVTGWYHGLTQDQMDNTNLRNLALVGLAKRQIQTRAGDQFKAITGNDLFISNLAPKLLNKT